jgi:hypothetical protein
VSSLTSSFAHRNSTRFALVATCFLISSALFACVAPAALSVAAVFLFAGPHNYIEARYFLTRLPARVGRLKTYFLISATGTLLLSLGYVAVSQSWIPERWGGHVWMAVVGCWNTAFLLWVATLAQVRQHQPPRRSWDLLWPGVLGIIGLTWLQPLAFPVAMAYLHPLMGLWILDRELSQRRDGFLPTYRTLLLLIPVAATVIWLLPIKTFHLPFTADLMPQDHVGAFLLPGVEAHRLLAMHVFLELLHYGVWLVAIPVASGRVWSDGFQKIPLMRGSRTRSIIRVMVLLAAAAVAVLWVCFALDYTTTRHVYFAFATVHVLAEVPFLLRLL